jgi:hypothetical protein
MRNGEKSSGISPHQSPWNQSSLDAWLAVIDDFLHFLHSQFSFLCCTHSPTHRPNHITFISIQRAPHSSLFLPLLPSQRLNPFPVAQSIKPGTYVQADILDTYDFDLVGDAAGYIEEHGDEILRSAMGSHSHSHD